MMVDRDHWRSTKQPNTASALLRELDVKDASVIQQRDTLHEWLVENVPSPSLKESLRQTATVSS